MPLLDHFHPPLAPRRHGESFHVNWAGAMADDLNQRLLPEGYFAEEHAQLGARVEIDVATFADEPSGGAAGHAVGAATLRSKVWTPPAPTFSLPAAFPDSFEVLIFENEGGARLVAAIELVSPANKDREAHRRAFAVKCASFLCRGISLVMIDIVSSRRANLHNDTLAVLGHNAEGTLPDSISMYAAAYRPIVRDGVETIETWTNSLSIGQSLPVLPLALNAETCLPLDLEATYEAACNRRRLS